jgi:hypothetical protein
LKGELVYMIMCSAHYNLKIENIIINHTEIEKTPNGKITVIGTCKVVPDDWGSDFLMDFTYIGKPNEPSSKMLANLKNMGWERYQNECKAETEADTLINFINKHKK